MIIDLDSPQWESLEHAYSQDASAIAEILKSLSKEKNEKEIARCWDNLWSSLCHQGSIYSATFAAIPHLVNIIAKKMKEGDIGAQYFIFLTAVELSNQVFDQQEPAVEISSFLKNEYEIALDKAMDLQYEIMRSKVSSETIYSLLSFQAAFKKEAYLANALMDFNGEEE